MLIMEIYLVRHGSPYAKMEDPERRLNDDGIKESHQVGKVFKQFYMDLDMIASSPKTRARQTAEIIAEEVGYSKNQIKITKALEPTVPAEEAISYLKDFTDKNRILLVGHLPSIGEIASELISGNANISMHFEAGGVCRVDVKQIPTNIGELYWFLTPGLLHCIA